MILFFFIILCFLTVYICQRLGRKQKTPKGLTEIPAKKGLPIIGIVKEIEKPLCIYLEKLSKIHGPIYNVRIGMRDVVVLNNFEYIKSVLVDNGDALSGRWKSLKYIFVTDDAGVVFIDGKVWAEQRSFVLKTLKDFGIGRSKSVEIVQDECIHMLEELENFEGQSLDFANFMPIFTANVISKFVMNKRFSHGDPDYLLIEKYMEVTASDTDPVSDLCLMFPFLENNDWLMRFIIWITSRRSIIDASHDLFRREIKEHLKNIDFNSNGENLIDRFLIKQHQIKKLNDSVGSFTDWQLVKIAVELLTAGYDTISSLLVWSIMLMGKYPEVQKRVHKELIDKIGNERLPTISDKVCLDYIQAVMDEIMRISSIAPLSLFHRTLSSINVKGYFIPKDTLVIPNIFACHVDQNTWEKPYEFYPEHFLHIADNGEYKYRPREELILFSMGKRQCLAESLARTEYFIFYTSIIQRYQVSLVNDKAHFDIFCANDGIIRTPLVRDFIFKRREKFHDK